MIDRRSFLALGFPLAAYALVGPGGALAQAGARNFGPPAPFSFERLRERAAAMARSDHHPRHSPAGDIIRKIDFDAVQKIQYRPDHTLWQDGPGAFPVRFFHLHTFVPEPVRINVVEGGDAREFLYSTRHFDYGDTGLDEILPSGMGYAGFRVMADREGRTDWLAFQGASYFRTSGAEDQYGASARGIAVNTGLETPEEFPDFTEFWLEPAPAGEKAVIVYALLDGPSLTGAYRFRCDRNNGSTTDVHAELFIRSDIRRLGIAPLTSMYWFGENDRRHADDWRPEIHDSDGLAIWTGSGERIFRPLVNPPTLQVNSFIDRTPKGFGLMQNDRDFNHYQDDGAFYDRRPGIWVEPIGDWGEGAVQLVEIPTDGETNDNIVSYWRPRTPARRGDTLTYDYRLHWRNLQPYPPDNVAQVVATRTGRGGRPGQVAPSDRSHRKFVIDFEGGPLSEMAARFDVTPVATASRGTVSDGYVIKVVGTKRWRAIFDIQAEGREPVDLRCFLRLGEKTLSETWLYQYFPPAA